MFQLTGFPRVGDSVISPARITASEVAAASKRFPWCTGTGADGIHPRAVASLSGGGLQSFAHLLNEVEKAGKWPDGAMLNILRALWTNLKEEQGCLAC